jgi:hypothetical protein
MRTGYNHYIRTNEAGEIIHGFSGAFEQPQDGDILICEDGPRHFHEAFPDPLQNERGQFRFRWQDGQIVERSQQELDDEWAQRPPAPPTLQQRVEAAEQALIALMEAMSDV